MYERDKEILAIMQDGREHTSTDVTRVLYPLLRKCDLTPTRANVRDQLESLVKWRMLDRRELKPVKGQRQIVYRLKGAPITGRQYCRGGNAKGRLPEPDREKRIVEILETLIGDSKTTIQVARIVPYDALSVRQVLRNLKASGYVTSNPLVCTHKGWVVWIITSLGLSRVDRARGRY